MRGRSTKLGFASESVRFWATYELHITFIHVFKYSVYSTLFSLRYRRATLSKISSNSISHKRREGHFGFDDLAVYILLRGLAAARLHRWPGRLAVRRPLSLQRCQKMLRTRTL